MNTCTSLGVSARRATVGDRPGIDLFLLLAVFNHHRGPPSFGVLPLAKTTDGRNEGTQRITEWVTREAIESIRKTCEGLRQMPTKFGSEQFRRSPFNCSCRKSEQFLLAFCLKKWRRIYMFLAMLQRPRNIDSRASLQHTSINGAPTKESMTSTQTGSGGGM